MPDLLIRNVPEDQVRRIDATPKKMGLSRTGFLRRQITQIAAQRDLQLESTDVENFAGLADEDLIRDAWS